ncbi:ankyrin repeat domain-containing protein [Nocardia cyriacigeorgica]|uniref:ankyrin repeat domain-containing protein n=1 Tax=Nocardia cyriacigeorgica TaxID=135487 RepID=UPI0018949C93|nr:ankyrin repeat domain-containing protein [Nocardia cyriacigeorgica]MBF6099081.1 ankyrin repeat domain-containing protein [Nocardia cyriacigeorgica]MBF6514901.1 ankyrin repeat domain-containing protein [Nocardia cyriacigeorgica]
MLGAEEFDLVMAVVRRDTDEVRRAHEAGVDLASVTTPGGTLLSWAAEWGRTEIIGFILDQGIEAEPATLSKAANKGHAEAVRLLLGHGMKPDLPAEWPPLCAAAYGGSPECVQLLLRAGARIDVRMGPQASSWGGKTPTELAAMHVTDGTAEILRLLAQ